MECTALGTPIRLSDEDVARSALLQHLKGTRGVFDLPFRVEHVRAWQAQKPDADDLFSIDDLEAGLKVADFMEDVSLAQLPSRLTVHLGDLLDRAEQEPSDRRTSATERQRLQAIEVARRNCSSHPLLDDSPAGTAAHAGHQDPSDVPPTAEARALALLQTLPLNAAAAALASTLCTLNTKIAALPRALHGAAVRAHCSESPSRGLHLSLNYMEKEDQMPALLAAGVLSPALHVLGRLGSLDIGCATSRSHGTRRLCDALRACSGLQGLTRLGFDAVTVREDILEALAPLTRLRTVAMRTQCSENPDRGNPSAPLPFILLGVLPQLESVVCFGCMTSPPTARRLRAPTALTRLQIADAALRDCEHIADGGCDLSGLSRLRHLDLSACSLSAAGVATLAAALPPLKQLTHLCLAHNGLDADAHGAVARLLAPATGRNDRVLRGVCPMHVDAALSNYAKL